MKYLWILLFVVVVAGAFVAANYDSLFGAEEESPVVEIEPVEETVEEPVAAPPVEDVVVVEEPEVTESVAEEPEPEEEAAEETTPEPPAQQTFKQFLDSAEKSYQGYGYWVDEVLTGPYGIVERDGVILLKFNRIQIVKNTDDDTIDTVLVYRANQTAVGTCLGIGCASSKDDIFEVPYEQYNPETILDKAEEYYNRRVVSVKNSIMVSDYDSSVVTLANGVKIHVGKKTHFPLLMQDKDGRTIKEVHGFFYEISKQDALTLKTKGQFPFD